MGDFARLVQGRNFLNYRCAVISGNLAAPRQAAATASRRVPVIRIEQLQNLMKHQIVLNRTEEEYLFRSLEAALQVRSLKHYFLWTQGLFQGLLPHEIMICIHLSPSGEVLHIKCLRSTVNSPELIELLCNPTDGLAVRMANFCRSKGIFPCVVARENTSSPHSMKDFLLEIESHQLNNAVVHGTDRLRDSNTFFALFSLPAPLTVRHAFFLDLLLPSLHLAFLRAIALGDEAGKIEPVNHKANVPAPLLTAREIEVLLWVTKGKSNHEIGVILALSTLTIKNHMQRIYKKLDVHNRAQAVSRCHTLQLLAPLDNEVLS
jgi:transcriptional regulator EpsA